MLENGRDVAAFVIGSYSLGFLCGHCVMAAGWLIALSREDARRWFGACDDDSLWRLVAELQTTGSSGKAIRQAVCDATQEAIKPALKANGASNAVDSYPLDHALLGGRLMTRDESRGHIYLKRPDTVAHIADGLARLSREEYREWFDHQTDPHVPIAGRSLEDAWRLLESIRDFYVRAANEKCAAVFVMEK